MSANNKTLTKLDKELAILFMATSFGKMHVEDVLEEREDKVQALVDLEKPIKLLTKLTNLAGLYQNRINPLAEEVVEIFEEIEQENKKLKPLRRFDKKVRLDQDGDIVINGLLFCTSLVLEHRNIKNRILRPDYKLAEYIHSVYENENNKAFENARTLCKKFADKLDDI